MPTSAKRKPKAKAVTVKGSRTQSGKPPPLPRHSEVALAYRAFPAPLRPGLQQLRRLVYAAAAQDPDIGELTETLRWGVPSYLTQASKNGTTVRLAVESKTADRFGLYVPCQTTLIGEFRGLYGDLFTYSGKRALLFEAGVPLPEAELVHCLSLAFTYHRRKRG